MTLPALQVQFRPGAGPFHDETDPGYLRLPGNVGAYATTPDTPSLDVTGDIDVRIDVTLPDWTPSPPGGGVSVTLAAKWAGAGGRSWRFYLNNDGTVGFQWSTDGTNSLSLSVTSALPVPDADGRLALRAQLDVNNGAGGRTLTIATAPGGSLTGTWTTLGTATSAGTTSIFSSSSPVSVGDYVGGTAHGPLEGHVHAFQCRTGLGGTVVANPVFSGHAEGVTGFTDSAFRPWTVLGDAHIVGSVDWVDLSDRLLAASWGYGRDNELDSFNPGSASVDLKNEDRALDPEHAGGPWYGLLEPRTPFRIRASVPSLSLSGLATATASTPDHASFAVTDLDVRVRIALGDWTPGGLGVFLAGQWPNVSGQNGWVFALSAAGVPSLSWTTGGVTAITRNATAATGFTDGTAHWLRVTLDVNNGAAQHVVTFYTSETGEDDDWTVLGAVVTTAGTTSIFNSPADLAISAVLAWAGRAYALDLRSGIGGAPVAAPDFTNVAPGATSFTDAVGRAWTVNGTAAITFDPTEVADQWYGFVKGGFEQGYRPPAQATCTVTLEDMLAVLDGEPLPQDAYGYEVLADGPEAFWRLDSIDGNEMTDSSGGGHHGRYGEASTADPLVSGGAGAVEFDHVGDWRGQATADSLPQSAPTTLEAWVRLPRDLTQAHTIIAAQRDYVFGSGLLLGIETSGAGSPDGQLVLNFFGLGAGLKVRGHQRVDDNEPHHVVAVINGTALADISLWVDGVQQTLTTIAGTAGGTWDGHRIWTVGNTVDTGSGDFGLGGIVDEAAVYRSALSPARIAAHHEAGVTAHAFERSGARVARVLDIVGLPAALRDIADGDTTVGAADYGGTSAGAYLDRIAESEQGALYVDHHNGGTLAFRGRYHRLTEARSTTVQWAFSDEDDPDALHVEAPSLRVKPNGIDSIVNIVEASWAGGTAVSRDEASIQRYGPQSRSIATEAPTASAAEGAGQWLIRRYARPQTRVTGCELAPDADQRLWPAALGLAISDRVSLRRHPQQVGDPLTNDLYAEGLKHTVTDGVSWQAELNLSHADAADAAWIWGTSAWGQTTTWG